MILTPREHRAKAEENARFLDQILPLVDQYPQWVATVAFYTALHLVDELLSRKGLITGTHKFRHDTLKVTDPYRRTLWPNFEPLHLASNYSRYFSPKAFQTKYPPRVVQNLLISTLLKNIRQAVKRELDLLDGTLESDLPPV